MYRGDNAHDDIPNRPTEEHRRYRIFMHTGRDVVVSEWAIGTLYKRAETAPWRHVGDVMMGPDDMDPLHVGMARVALEKWATLWNVTLTPGDRFWLMDDETDGDVYAVRVGVTEDDTPELVRS